MLKSTDKMSQLAFFFFFAPRVLQFSNFFNAAENKTEPMLCMFISWKTCPQVIIAALGEISFDSPFFYSFPGWERKLIKLLCSLTVLMFVSCKSHSSIIHFTTFLKQLRVDLFNSVYCMTFNSILFSTSIGYLE